MLRGLEVKETDLEAIPRPRGTECGLRIAEFRGDGMNEGRYVLGPGCNLKGDLGGRLDTGGDLKTGGDFKTGGEGKRVTGALCLLFDSNNCEHLISNSELVIPSRMRLV